MTADRDDSRNDAINSFIREFNAYNRKERNITKPETIGEKKETIKEIIPKEDKRSEWSLTNWLLNRQPNKRNSRPTRVSNFVDYPKLICQIILWILLQAIFYRIEFGLPFLIVSLIFFIYFNTGKRRSGKSAYSVFNENVEAISGTFDGKYYEDLLKGRQLIKR
ncbi:hypothetical protein SNEBB_006815 [Seison nebaliae]|nr:hypothetical protein SNEBB_006815 [Seison nebaliae]